jgi:NAD-dependent dihydropyrimidine dehydrogenase PreA subunit
MIELIVADRCNGCNACVSACPTHVLDPAAINGDPPVIARQDQCQTCFMCELYCPQDAIYVGPRQDRAEPVDQADVLASGQLGRVRRNYGWDGSPDPLANFWRLGPLLQEGAQIAGARHEQAKALRDESAAT